MHRQPVDAAVVVTIPASFAVQRPLVEVAQRVELPPRWVEAVRQPVSVPAFHHKSNIAVSGRRLLLHVDAGVCDCGFGIDKDAVFIGDVLQMQVR